MESSNMYSYDKLSEKTLGKVLHILFNNLVESQKRIKISTKTLIVDYSITMGDDQFFFEFDGPTHYQNSKCQLRDLMLEEYCIKNKINLIRIPYFIQLDEDSIYSLFDIEIISKYKLSETILNTECEYVSGFYDKKITLPGDWNEYGFKLFMKMYRSMVDKDTMYVMRQIYDSLESFNASKELIFGIDYKSNKDKLEFINNYPT